MFGSSWTPVVARPGGAESGGRITRLPGSSQVGADHQSSASYTSAPMRGTATNRRTLRPTPSVIEHVESLLITQRGAWGVDEGAVAVRERYGVREPAESGRMGARDGAHALARGVYAVSPYRFATEKFL